MRPPSMLKAVFGVLLFVGGAIGMTAVAAASYGHGAACQRMLFALGLPGSLLLSSLSQCGVFLGAWMLWSAWRPGRAPS